MYGLLKNSQKLRKCSQLLFGTNINQISGPYKQMVNPLCGNIKFISNSNTKGFEPKQQIKSELAPNVQSKYENFSDENATIILDIEEERDKLLIENNIRVKNDDVANVNYERKPLI